MSRQNDSDIQQWKQEAFSRGLIKNAPHDDLPDSSVAGLVNAHCYDTEIQPRLASWLYSELQPPAWRNDCGDPLDDLVLEKDGTLVTAEVPVFTPGLVSCYIAWPTSDGFFHDEISEYVSPTQVRVTVSETRGPVSECYIHGRLNLNSFHKRKRTKIWQFGKRVYTSDIDYVSFTECLCVSRYKPSNVISDFDEMDDYGMLGNSNGLFKLSFDQTVPMLWQANGPVPDVLLEGRQRRKEHKYRYDYLYSMARFNGAGIRGTLTGAKIVQRSGTTALNTDVTPNRDYSTYWTEKPIGSGIATGGRLVTDTVAAANRLPSYWHGIAAPGVSFKFTHNDRTEEFLVDMSDTGYDVHNMDDVANALQHAINTLFSWVEVSWDESGFFVFTTGREPNATMGYLTDGVGGTNVAGILQGRDGDGATLDNSWDWSGPNQVGIVYNPTNRNRYEWHWNYYTLWRTTDISENGADPRTTEDGEELQPLKFTYCGDYRIAAAFYASKTNGIVTARIGTFEKADEGTPLKWEDGSTDTISEYISSSKVRVGSDYYGNTKPLQACALGGGRVLRASQDGRTVTLETEFNSDYFSSSECDERKTIYWSDGYESVITDVIDNNTVTVHDTATREEQGITIDPTCRVITDTYTDETLRQLMDEPHAGLLNMRFKTHMPNGNILSVVPGFMLTAKRGDSLIPYCDLPNSAKYEAGYYLENRQVIDKIEGSIQLIVKAPNYFLVWCNNSLWGGPTNNPDIKKLPEFGEWYGVLHADIIDGYIGAVDWGSIEEVDYGTYELVCQDYSVRQLQNRVYTEDYTFDPITEQDRIAKDFKECWNIGASAYSRTLGHVFWRTVR